MNVFITGASGFIGKHLIDYLLKKKNLKIFFILKNNIRNQEIQKNYSKNKRVNILFGDYTNLNQLKDVISKCNFICNLGFPNKIDFKKKIKKTNYLKSLINIIKCLENKKKFKFVHISSSEVYGFKKVFDKKKFSENSKTCPVNNYAKAKLDAEKIILNSGNNIIKNTIILRLFNVYGKGQNPKSLILEINNKLLNSNFDISLKNIYDKRDYIFLKDVLSAIQLSLFNKKSFGIFNVCSGKAVSVKKIFDIIKKLITTKSNLIDSRNIKSANLSKGNNQKILKELKWQPKYLSNTSFKTNLKKIIIYKNN